MKYQNTLEDNKVQCEICPRRCIIADGQSGFCTVRKNFNGEIILNTYGYNTGLAIDPVEKKPLYHFFPNTNVLSFGTLGCNMGCLFCQNWKTTKNSNVNYPLHKATPEDIVATAKKYNCKSIAFTYNDPIVFFEYALDTAKLCQKEGIKTIAVTSGFINKEPAAEFFKYIDAANIDLKGFSEEFYKKNCLASIEPILDTIKYVKNETNTWLEITTMLIENENDSDNELKAQIDWLISNIGKSTPIHFSAFFPNYKFQDKKPTNIKTLLKARKIALDMGLDYVYTGNLANEETSTTFCKNCKKPIIKRIGYNLIEYNLNNGKCIYCNTKCDGCFD